MAASKFIAFDFGAESGRAVIGTLDGKTIGLQEIHRFPNRQVEEDGHIHWDMPYLFEELRNGLAAASRLGQSDILGVGVDTWGVDYGLVGKDNRLLGNPYAYRDSRTDGMIEKAFTLLPKSVIYSYTGNQFLQFNTIFQLLSSVDSERALLDETETLLFMPDLFNFYMTGEKCSEYTLVSTSQLLNAEKGVWEREIFEKLDLPIRIMAPIVQPGTVIGRLSAELSEQTGLPPIEIIAPATHDTASAVAAVPARSANWAYLSSGTWSLLGVEANRPIITDQSLANNFTNEGGVNGTIRFLRNTMGLWLLQKCRSSWEEQGQSVGYEKLITAAAKAQPFRCLVDPDDATFLNPPDMPAAIADYCQKTNQPVPGSKGEFVRCILESLALKYRFMIDMINSMRTEAVETLHIVGGGSQNEMLNQFAANATALPVIAGPVEATALGNILIQAIAKGELSGIEEGRQLIARSFPLKEYKPTNHQQWNEVYQKTKPLFS